MSDAAKYNGENIRKVDGLRFALPFLRFAFLLKISPDVHFYLVFLSNPTLCVNLQADS